MKYCHYPGYRVKMWLIDCPDFAPICDMLKNQPLIWQRSGTDSLPYVLNGPIYLFLFEIFSMSEEVDILHNIGMLQD